MTGTNMLPDISDGVCYRHNAVSHFPKRRNGGIQSGKMGPIGTQRTSVTSYHIGTGYNKSVTKHAGL
ncbi:hypothetical protein GCM10007171_26710 [Dickeya fangzhongdai]|nr:hypothetical protein GCM10007171_26710 [Dickeya fangzhongdai]